MSKNRYINTKFWDDSFISELNTMDKLLFIYCITNPLTNICGIYEVPVKRIAFDTGIDKDSVEKILLKFEIAGKMKYQDGWIAIKNFIKHQKQSENPNDKINIGIDFEMGKAPLELVEWVKGNTSPLQAPCIPLTSPLQGSSENTTTTACCSSNQEEVSPLQAPYKPLTDPLNYPNSNSNSNSNRDSNVQKQKTSFSNLDLEDIKNNPLFLKSKTLNFPELTENEIDLQIETYLTDYPKAKAMSVFNYLAEQNSKKLKNKPKDNQNKGSSSYNSYSASTEISEERQQQLNRSHTRDMFYLNVTDSTIEECGLDWVIGEVQRRKNDGLAERVTISTDRQEFEQFYKKQTN